MAESLVQRTFFGCESYFLGWANLFHSSGVLLSSASAAGIHPTDNKLKSDAKQRKRERNRFSGGIGCGKLGRAVDSYNSCQSYKA